MPKKTYLIKSPKKVLRHHREAEYRILENPVERAARLVMNGVCSISVATAAVISSGIEIQQSAVCNISMLFIIISFSSLITSGEVCSESSQRGSPGWSFRTSFLIHSRI